MAALPASAEAWEASSLAMFASAPHGLPASNRLVALNRSKDAASTLALAWASGNATPWLAPIGLPNTSRRDAYSLARSRKNSPSPMASLARRHRSALKPSRTCRNPRPSTPMRCPAGTRRPEKNTW